MSKRFGHTDYRTKFKPKIKKIGPQTGMDKKGIYRERIPGVKRDSKGNIIDPGSCPSPPISKKKTNGCRYLALQGLYLLATNKMKKTLTFLTQYQQS